jgi:uncharacterized protein (TIRG00374 family)
MKQTLRLAGSLALSAFFLWLAFRSVDFAAALRLLSTVSLPLVGLYVLTLAFTQWARAARWEILVRPFVHLSSAAAFRISNLGAMLVLVLPLRLGELSRPYLMKREHGAPLSAGVGAVVVERAIDGLLVTLFFFLSTMISGDDSRVPRGLRLAAFAALLGFAAVTAVIIATLLWRDVALRVTGRVLGKISGALAHRLTGMLSAFVDGLRALPDGRSVLGVIVWTAVFWLANGLGLFFVMRAFGWSVPVTAGFTLVSVIVIAIMIPAGPGFLGTYQGGILAGLAVYGIGYTEAAAYGLVVYPLNVLVVVAFGLPYLFSRREEIREVVRVSPPAV